MGKRVAGLARGRFPSANYEKELLDVLLANPLGLEEELARGFEAARWPDGLKCPRCGHEHISRLKDYHKFECAACEYQFSVTSGTFMHKTRAPLRAWLVALYWVRAKWQLGPCAPRGFNLHLLASRAGVSYPTAWRMAKLLRKAAANGPIEFDQIEQVLGLERRMDA